MKSIKNFLMVALTAIVGIPPNLVRAYKYGRVTVALACNAFTPSTHCKTITKFTAAAITTRYLLAKSDGTATGITICTSGDKAMFIVKDTASASADLSLTNPAPVACIMLGVTDETVPMIAARALAVGTVVYPGLLGQVDSYVGLGSTGTNYPVGVIVANASAQAGDIVEVMSVLEFQSATA